MCWFVERINSQGGRIVGLDSMDERVASQVGQGKAPGNFGLPENWRAKRLLVKVVSSM